MVQKAACGQCDGPSITAISPAWLGSGWYGIMLAHAPCELGPSALLQSLEPTDSCEATASLSATMRRKLHRSRSRSFELGPESKTAFFRFHRRIATLASHFREDAAMTFEKSLAPLVLPARAIPTPTRPSCPLPRPHCQPRRLDLRAAPLPQATPPPCSISCWRSHAYCCSCVYCCS